MILLAIFFGFGGGIFLSIFLIYKSFFNKNRKTKIIYSTISLILLVATHFFWSLLNGFGDGKHTFAERIPQLNLIMLASYTALALFSYKSFFFEQSINDHLNEMKNGTLK